MRWIIALVGMNRRLAAQDRRGNLRRLRIERPGKRLRHRFRSALPKFRKCGVADALIRQRGGHVAIDPRLGSRIGPVERRLQRGGVRFVESWQRAGAPVLLRELSYSCTQGETCAEFIRARRVEWRW